MVELTGGIGTQQRQPGTASQPGRRRNEGSPPAGYRAGHLSFVLTLGRPPVTGSVAENRAAPDSLAHTADATQAQNRKAGPAITGGPFGGGSSPLTRPARARSAFWGHGSTGLWLSLRAGSGRGRAARPVNRMEEIVMRVPAPGRPPPA